MTCILYEVGLPSFDTLRINSIASFERQCDMCNNRLIRYMQELHVYEVLDLSLVFSYSCIFMLSLILLMLMLYGPSCLK